MLVRESETRGLEAVFILGPGFEIHHGERPIPAEVYEFCVEDSEREAQNSILMSIPRVEAGLKIDILNEFLVPCRIPYSKYSFSN